MADQKRPNDEQQQAIETVDGPVLIIAGPGTGKTFTLVKRAIYLIEEKHVLPEEILMATFTKKAAKELVTRITNEMANRGIPANLNEMYVGDFHSICLRIINEHLECTRLKKNYTVLDEFDQCYTVFQNYYKKFRDIDSIDRVLRDNGKRSNRIWDKCKTICDFVNKLSEELVDPAKLMADEEREIAVLGEILNAYNELLADRNMVDYSGIQTEAYRLLQDHPEVLSKLHKKIRYIMIDEYQDTNYIQEKLVFLLGGEHKNICVVGDDDQGLYRFRGATIRNILEFPDKFKKGECKQIKLNVNHRSNSDIVDFCNWWMSKTEGDGFSFWRVGERNFRFEKAIEPDKRSTVRSKAVVKLTEFDWADWYEKILTFIQGLMASGKITDYNQIAFLFRSVKYGNAPGLARYLEENGINVYSPRSDMFFERDEIRLMLGCLMRMFPEYVRGLENEEYLPPNSSRQLKNDFGYYRSCLDYTNDYLSKPEHAGLRDWIDKLAKTHSGLQEATDYGYSGLVYRLFRFPPFSDYLSREMDAGINDLRPARNLARFTQIIGKFEHLYRISVLDPGPGLKKRRVDENTEWLFNRYIVALYDGGLREYEDEAEYAPSGCVSFLTIHQAKGMEFPIVIVDTSKQSPEADRTVPVMVKIEGKYFEREHFEPDDHIPYFDLWRLFYTAFSRAQDLLLLTCCGNFAEEPTACFEQAYDRLPDVNGDEFDIEAFTFQEVQKANLKETFAFTTHISVYDTCARQYKMYKKLGFEPVRTGGMVFGTLVHQTIEDIHKAALRQEENLITEENIAQWLDRNYDSLLQVKNINRGEEQKKAALKQVLRYAAGQGDSWNAIREAEVDVSLVEKDYIILGTIDLIKEAEDGTFELVDFKTGEKPKQINGDERVDLYKRQLQVYAHLVEKQFTDKKVSKMNLYYTGDKSGTPTVSFPYREDEIDKTIESFDATVHKILNNDFTHTAQDSRICNECDFRFYCRR